MKYFIVLAFAAFVFCDLKSDLLKKAEDLEKQTADEITKLEAQNKSALTVGLKHEVDLIKELAKELQNENGTLAIGLLENELNLAETRIARELLLVERPTSNTTKETLLQNALIIESYVRAEVITLREQGHNLVAIAMEGEARRLETISAELKTALTPRRTRELEVELRLIETRVTEELRRLGFRTATPAPSTTARPATSPASATTARPVSTSSAPTTARPATTSSAPTTVKTP